jgi:PII-like signaling protein
LVDAIKLSVYFGERDRAGSHTSAEAIARTSTAAGIRTAVLVRAIEGFGSRGAVQTERMLTLSEDLPLVWTAIDLPERIAALAETVTELIPQGLVTLERCGIVDTSTIPDADSADELKLTITLGRGQRSGGQLAYLRVVDHLQDCGVDGAYVMLGVDGILHGVRSRARLIGANTYVPAQVVAIGTRRDIARAVPGLRAHGAPALVTAEQIRVLKRDGRSLAPIAHPPASDADGHPIWQMLTLITRQDAVADGEALYITAMRELRAAGARGGTVLAGVWGYSGTAAPHGDSMRRLRRSIPVACAIIDTPDAIARLWPVLDGLTGRGGLVTSEVVPAFRTHGPVGTHGRLHLSRPQRTRPAGPRE